VFELVFVSVLEVVLVLLLLLEPELGFCFSEEEVGEDEVVDEELGDVLVPLDESFSSLLLELVLESFSLLLLLEELLPVSLF
jgi:hypothetical protein